MLAGIKQAQQPIMQSYLKYFLSLQLAPIDFMYYLIKDFHIDITRREYVMELSPIFKHKSFYASITPKPKAGHENMSPFKESAIFFPCIQFNNKHRQQKGREQAHKSSQWKTPEISRFGDPFSLKHLSSTISTFKTCNHKFIKCFQPIYKENLPKTKNKMLPPMKLFSSYLG